MCKGMRRLDDSEPRLGRSAPGGQVPRRRGLAIALTAATLLLAACGGHRSGERPPPTVGVVTIEPQPVTLTTELPGRTSPYEISDVRPQVGGIIQARLFVEGCDRPRRPGALPDRAGPVPGRLRPGQGAAGQRRGQPRRPRRLKAERYAGLVKINVGQPGRTPTTPRPPSSRPRPRSSRTRRRSRPRRSTSATPASPRRSPGGSASRPSPRARWSPRARPRRSTPSSGSIRSTSTSPSRRRRSLALRRQMAQGGRRRRRPSAQARLTLDDGSAYPLAGQLQFTDITVDQTTGAVTLRAVFPNPRRAAAGHVRARDGHRGRQSGRPPGARSRASARDQKGQPTALVVNRAGRVGAAAADRSGQTVGRQVAGDRRAWRPATG